MGLVMGFVGPNGSGSNWDGALFRDLLGRFAIDLSARVETLSRGEGVKLSVAMALAHRPEVLILDEPTSGLDPVSRADLVDILREFMVDPVHCILFSTHITSDLDSLADLIPVIDAGRIAYSGSIDGLHEEFAMVQGTEQLTATLSEAALADSKSTSDRQIRGLRHPQFRHSSEAGRAGRISSAGRSLGRAVAVARIRYRRGRHRDESSGVA